MRRNKTDYIDYNQMLIGIIGFLNQFHSSNSQLFLGYLSQYAKSAVNYSLFQKDHKAQAETNLHLANLIVFFEDFLRFSTSDKEVTLPSSSTSSNPFVSGRQELSTTVSSLTS